MRNYFTIALLFFLTQKVISQNLVNNPSFENYSDCPTGGSQLNAFNWNVTPNSGEATPDYFNGCDSGLMGVPTNSLGNENAYDGIAYAGLVCYHITVPIREYLQSRLSSPLVSGQTYYVSFRASPAERFGTLIGSLGAHLSLNPISGNGTYEPINVSPQIISSSIISNYNGWTLITGSFVANGGEEYITIGNFSTNELTPNTVNSSAIVPIMSYEYIDMVVVTSNPLSVHEFQKSDVIIFPNPFKDSISIKYDNKNVDDIIEVFTTSGQVIKRMSGIINEISLSNFPNGIYYISIYSKNTGKLVRKIVKI
jgi:OOP family OmpA-OmpF porin